MTKDSTAPPLAGWRLQGLDLAHQDPQAAAREIERWLGHPHLVQVMIVSGARAPYGQRQYYPIYEACERHGLPRPIHPRTDGSGIDLLQILEMMDAEAPARISSSDPKHVQTFMSASLSIPYAVELSPRLARASATVRLRWCGTVAVLTGYSGVLFERIREAEIRPD